MFLFDLLFFSENQLRKKYATDVMYDILSVALTELILWQSLNRHQPKRRIPIRTSWQVLSEDYGPEPVS